MTVEQGMDTDRARSVSDGLTAQGHALDTLAVQGSAMMQVLEGAWGGPDSEHFSTQWSAARPAIDRAAQSVTDMGRELLRQAEQQDLASARSEFGPTPPPMPKDGEPVPLPDVPTGPFPPFPPLPPMPDIFDTIKEIVGGVIDTLRSWWFGAGAWFAGLLSDIDDALKFLARSPIVRLIFKGLGRVTPILGLVLGLWDLGQSIYRFFTEGFTKDSVLQFFQGLTGTAAAVLGIAALFASGTIIGLPAAPVLLVLAGVLGAISIGIGIYRAFDDEIDAAVKGLAPYVWPIIKPYVFGDRELPIPTEPAPYPGPRMPEGPGMPAPYPGPQMPEGPGMPAPYPGPELPKGPGMPTPNGGGGRSPWPGMPSLPSIPGIGGLAPVGTR